MSKTFDTYCIEVTDLEAARQCLEEILSTQFNLHESDFWGGEYYLISSNELGKITIRRNHNSYTNGLNEPGHPNCQIIVSVSAPLHPDVIRDRFMAHGLRLLDRSVVG